MKQIARLVAASLIVVTLSCGTDAVPYRSTGTQVLFGKDCLADVRRAAHR